MTDYVPKEKPMRTEEPPLDRQGLITESDLATLPLDVIARVLDRAAFRLLRSLCDVRHSDRVNALLLSGDLAETDSTLALLADELGEWLR
jgi:hypothetical protein